MCLASSNPSHYDTEKVKTAVASAEKLHLNKSELSPKNFATTVYILPKKMIAMLLPEAIDESATEQ